MNDNNAILSQSQYPEAHQSEADVEPQSGQSAVTRSSVLALVSDLQAERPLTGGHTAHLLFQLSAVTVLLVKLIYQPFNMTQLTPLALVLLLLEYGWARTLRRTRVAEHAFMSSYVGFDRLNPMIELAFWPEPNLRLLARYHLLRLVRDIGPGQHDTFIDQRHSAMLAGLLTPLNALQFPTLVIALLQMYTRMGDVEALPYLPKLLRLNLRPSVFNAARQCYDQLSAPAYIRPRNAVPADESASEVFAPDPAPIDEQRDNSVSEAASTVRNVRSGFLCASIVTFVPFGLYSAVKYGATANWIAAGLSLVVAVIPAVIFRVTMRPDDVGRIQELSSQGKPENVGHLVDALSWPDIHCRNVAIEGLITLLPKLKTRDRRFLSAEQQAELLGFLKPQLVPNYHELIIAILKCLEQVGDESALLPVEQLAALNPSSVVQRRVSDAAKHCLLFLPQVAAANTASSTLLRMSQPETGGPNDLLRPSPKGPNTEGEYLIRSSSE